MGILSASNALTRFRLLEAVPKDFWTGFLDKLQQFAFIDIDDNSLERSFGWVAFDHMLDTKWTSAPPDKGAYMTFSLRLDTRRLSSAVLKKHMLIAMQAESEKNEAQGKRFISRERRIEIKDNVKLSLMRKVLPVPAVFDVVWATDTGLIYLASTHKAIIDLFEGYFAQSFELHIEQLNPYTSAASMIDEKDLILLDKLEQSVFI